jgi:uncharacterized protein (TIGR01244 family)
MKNWIGLMMILTAITFAWALPLNEVPNLQHPRFDVFTSGQPSEEGFKQVAVFGIKTVINVLPERNRLPGEAGMVTGYNMVYRSIPFKLTEFRKETIEQFADLLKKTERPVLIHCTTGNHVGALWFAYRILEENAPLGIALEEGRQIGMRPETEAVILNWIVNQDRRAAL